MFYQLWSKQEQTWPSSSSMLQREVLGSNPLRVWNYSGIITGTLQHWATNRQQLENIPALWLSKLEKTSLCGPILWLYVGLQLVKRSLPHWQREEKEVFLQVGVQHFGLISQWELSTISRVDHGLVAPQLHSVFPVPGKILPGADGVLLAASNCSTD